MVATNRQVAPETGEIFGLKSKADFVVTEGDETPHVYHAPPGKNISSIYIHLYIFHLYKLYSLTSICERKETKTSIV